jgi:delta 1-pyrroline-5-carboxylate dehydrogenase
MDRLQQLQQQLQQQQQQQLQLQQKQQQQQLQLQHQVHIIICFFSSAAAGGNCEAISDGAVASSKVFDYHI